MSINNKLALGVQLVASYLQSIGVVNKIASFSEEQSVVKASLTDEHDKIMINAVGVEIEPHKTMLSLYRGNQSLGQAIFDYEKDLEMKDVHFPITVSEFLESRERVLQSIDLKFNLRAASGQNSSPGQYPQNLAEPVLLGTAQAPELPRANNLPDARRRPSDMPSFEDEYEVQNRPQTSEPARPLRGYGDADLYPMGQRNPLIGDPSLVGPSGGMVLDPMQELARRRESEQAKSRGPGWMPGTKYDDPFGGPSGFGPGGFI